MEAYPEQDQQADDDGAGGKENEIEIRRNDDFGDEDNRSENYPTPPGHDSPRFGIRTWDADTQCTRAFGLRLIVHQMGVTEGLVRRRCVDFARATLRREIQGF